MTTQDELAELILPLLPYSDIPDVVDAQAIADAVRARWRLVGRYKCAYKSSHDDKQNPDDTCCGQTVIPWEEESVR